MSGSIDPKGIERIEAIQVEIGLGMWDADKKDLALIKTAFEALKSGTLGDQEQLVKSLANAVTAKVVTDLEWPWIRKVASAVYRIFTGGVSLPHALLDTMTEDQLKLVVEGLEGKIKLIQQDGTLYGKEETWNVSSFSGELEKECDPSRELDFSIDDFNEMASQLEKLRDQLGDVANDAINKFGKDAECVKDIASVDQKLQLALDQIVYKKFQKEFENIWKAYPATKQKVQTLSFGGPSVSRMEYVKNDTRDKKLRELYAQLSTQTKGWTKDKYPDLKEGESPLFLCAVLKKAINKSINNSRLIS